MLSPHKRLAAAARPMHQRRCVTYVRRSQVVRAAQERVRRGGAQRQEPAIQPALVLRVRPVGYKRHAGLACWARCCFCCMCSSHHLPPDHPSLTGIRDGLQAVPGAAVSGRHLRRLLWQPVRAHRHVQGRRRLSQRQGVHLTVNFEVEGCDKHARHQPACAPPADWRLRLSSHR